jgi:hypothetical protein
MIVMAQAYIGRMRSPRVLPLAVLLAACTVGVGAVAASATATSTAPAPRTLAAPDVTATQLLNRFFASLAAGDRARLGALLSPAWMIQRANGTSATRSQYLAAMPTVLEYRITDVVAQYARPTLVVRSKSSTQEPSGGGIVVSALAPRLSTFTWSGGRWRMTSHGNFNATP